MGPHLESRSSGNCSIPNRYPLLAPSPSGPQTPWAGRIVARSRNSDPFNSGWEASGGLLWQKVQGCSDSWSLH